MPTISRYDGDIRWVSVWTAARILGVSRQRVYQLIDAGALVGLKDANTVLVSARTAEARKLLLEREEVDCDAAR